jgi:seryl-tRNA synthetase
MLDIKWIRDNPEALDEALKKRSAEPMAATLLALDDKRRSVIQKLQDMQSRRNAASKEIGAAMAQKNTELADKLKAEVAELKDSMPSVEQEEREAVAALEDALSRIPNIPLDDVPVGKDEHDNVVKHVVGERPRWNQRSTSKSAKRSATWISSVPRSFQVLVSRC